MLIGMLAGFIISLGIVYLLLTILPPIGLFLCLILCVVTLLLQYMLGNSERAPSISLKAVRLVCSIVNFIISVFCVLTFIAANKVTHSMLTMVLSVIVGIGALAAAIGMFVFMHKKIEYIKNGGRKFDRKRRKRGYRRALKKDRHMGKLDDVQDKIAIRRANAEFKEDKHAISEKQKRAALENKLEAAKTMAEIKEIKNAGKKSANEKLDDKLEALEMKSRLAHAKNQMALEDMDTANQLRAGKSNKRIIDAQYKVIETNAKGDLAEAKAEASMKRATGVITGAASTGMVLGGAAGGIVGGIAAGKEVGHQVGVAKASQMQAKALEDKNRVLKGANLTDEQTTMIADTEAKNYQSAKGFQNKVDEGIQRALSMGFEAARQKAIAMGIGSSDMTDKEIAHKVLEFSSPVQVESLPDGLTEEQQAQCILCG